MKANETCAAFKLRDLRRTGMLRVKHLLELAKISHNFAAMATTDEERAELLAMAEEYERRAALRVSAMKEQTPRRAS
jgi:hypothetical protein